MRILLIAILFTNYVFLLNPGGKFSINVVVYNKIKEKIIPNINQKMTFVELANYSRMASQFELNFSKSHFIMIPIAPGQVIFSFQTGASKLNATVLQILANVSFDIDYDISKEKNHIHCDAILKNTNIESVISNDINSGGFPVVKVSGKINIDSSKAQLIYTGNASAKVLQMIDPYIRQYITDSTNSAINAHLPLWIQDEINTILSYFQADMKVTDNMFVNYELTSVGLYQDNFLCVPLSTYIYLNNKKFPPSFSPGSLPDYNKSLSTKNIQIFISDYLIRSVVKLNFDQGIFVYNFTYNKVSPYSMNLTCEFQELPRFSFIDLNLPVFSYIQFYCKSIVYNKNDHHYTPLEIFGTFYLNLGYYIKQNVLFFKINFAEVALLYYTAPDWFNMDWFLMNCQDIAQIPALYLNESYFSYGIPLPNMSNLNYEVTYTDINSQYISIFADIK